MNQRMMIGSLLVSLLLAAGCSANPGSGAARSTSRSAPAHETTLTVTGRAPWNERLNVAVSVPGRTLKAGVRYPAVVYETNEGTAAVSANTWDLLVHDRRGRMVFDWAVASGESNKPAGHYVPVFLSPGRTELQTLWFELPGAGTYTLTLASDAAGPGRLPTVTVEAR